MQISSINNTNAYNIIEKTSSSNVSFEVKQNNSADPILEYYYDLCEQYPGITFRLLDMETLAQTDSRVIGYKNSLHQVGDNFGAIGQCSIEIEINVIKRMMEDPSYEMSVKDQIARSQRNYPQYELQTKACGMIYTSVTLEDDNGRLVEGITRSRMSYSTEEELLAMRAETNKSYADMIKEQIADNVDMFDSLMEMLDKSREKQRELAKKYYESDHAGDSNKNVKDELLRKHAVDEYDKHILTA